MKGFTLIEIMVTIGVFAILMLFITVNLVKPQVKYPIDAAVTTLAADIKEQQLKTMLGDNDGTGTPQIFGIHFDPTSYTLFRGTYSLGNSSNLVIKMPENVGITTNLASDLIFTRLSGEVNGYSATQNTITVRSNISTEQRVVSFNKLGVLTIN